MGRIFIALRISIVATLLLTIWTGFAYPSVVWGIAQLLFPAKAQGSLIEKDGKIVGSTLLGQRFSSPQYFIPRPSAAGKGYDAANSSGSNLGPISSKYLGIVNIDAETNNALGALSSVAQRVEAYRKFNNIPNSEMIPQDAVTASGSGLDPHISPRNAELQLARVAHARGMSEDMVRSLLKTYTEEPDLGIFGESRVNVLRLNLALDVASNFSSRP